MIERLRDDLDALEVAAAAVAEATGIPAAHVEKDFWLTEALRVVARAAEVLGVPVYFKGGTSLSKVFGLIRRFSEDIDILAVLRHHDSAGARHKVLKALCEGAIAATGLDGQPIGDKSSKGEKRAVTLRYPTRQTLQPLRHEGVLVEIGHWGGTYPHERHAVRSLIAEHRPALSIDGRPFAEFEPFEVDVLDPVRTAVEKLMLLHAAAAGEAERRFAVARHLPQRVVPAGARAHRPRAVRSACGRDHGPGCRDLHPSSWTSFPWAPRRRLRRERSLRPVRPGQ